MPPERIVVHGNNKSDEELAAAAEADAWLVVMDEPGEVERCVQLGVKRVLLRVTPGIEADAHVGNPDGHVGSKFGVAAEDAPGRDRGRARGGAGAARPARPPRLAAAGRRSAGRFAVEWLAGLRRRDESGARLDAADREPGRRPRDPARPGRSRAPTRRDTRARCPSAWRTPGRCRVSRGRSSSSSRAARWSAGPGVTLYRVGVVKRSGRHDVGRSRRRHVGQPAPGPLRRELLGAAGEPRRRAAPPAPTPSAASIASPATS